MPLIGEINLLVLGLVFLGLIVAAVCLFLTPSALRHSVDSHFTRLPDGRLVFSWGIRSGRYVVADEEREQELRCFARRASAVSMVAGIAVMASSFVLIAILWPLCQWLARVAEIPADDLPLLFGFLSVTIAFGVLFLGLALWRRSAVAGLVVVEEEVTQRSPQDQGLTNFFRDLPAVGRWFVLAVTIYLAGYCFIWLWHSRSDFTLEQMRKLSFYGWFSIICSGPLGLYFFAWLLIRMLRSWPRGRAE